MGVLPISKFIAEDYRQTLGTNDAPSFIDTETPIIPVAVVNQQLPKPNSKQKLKYGFACITAAATTLQIATRTATTKIYFLGFDAYSGNATSQTFVIYDATSGTGPSFSNNTIYTDESGLLADFTFASASATLINHLPLPVELKQGLRITGGATSSCYFVFWYIEEQI